MDEIRKKAIDHLLKRRKAIQEQYDAVVAEPASYGITGSVNATNRSPEELRKELVAIDEKLNALLNRGGVAGMTTKWPDYRHSPLGGIEVQ